MTLGSSSSPDSAGALTSFAADLTDTAYSVALRHGLRAPFIDVELALWRELRAHLHQSLMSADSAGPAAVGQGWPVPCCRSHPSRSTP